MNVSPEQVRESVAAFLDLDPATLDGQAPLAAYGLDSLGSLELAAFLEDSLGCKLSESLLAECDNLERLGAAIAGSTVGSAGPCRLESLMLSDSRLPEHIRPSTTKRPDTGAHRALLTGATGFLGASLARALIDSGVHIVALARANAATATHRVQRNLERYGLWHSGLASGLTVVTGDLNRPRLGLEVEEYERLCMSVDSVYHAAADVNWVSSYEALRGANVLGTTEVLRFACAGVAKPFRFVSSMSVCYACNHTGQVCEDTDMLPLGWHLPIGYAQSKCVGEALVRAAAERGLPAQIYRPALIAGHSVSGASNTDDLVAALLKGCIQMRAAPDLDWTFDAIPVDTAAQAIVRMGQSAGQGLETFHLCHPRPRHWRECVLWANVFGYDIRLEPYEAWVERLLREAVAPDHALYRLRGFFARKVEGRTVPEHYQTHVRSQVSCSWTRTQERAAGVVYPPLDGHRLNAYFDDYIERDFLRRPDKGTRPRRGVPRGDASWATPSYVQQLLAAHFADPDLHVRNVELISQGSDHSVTSELTSCRDGRRVGLFLYRLQLTRGGADRTLDLMIKSKASDDDVIEVAELTAGICDSTVRRELTRCRELIGVRNSHLRELEVYSFGDAAFRRSLPECYGTWRDDAGRSWGLVLERLKDMAVMDAADEPDAWTDEHVATVVDGLADLHGVWLGREAELEAMSWIGHVRTSGNAAQLLPLWRALADHAAPMFSTWADAELARTHTRLVETSLEWWPSLERLPRTLIHNDFNPRNVGLRKTGDGPRLVAYDWELATVGAPQRDLAEFLCFVLPADTTFEQVSRWIERHRLRLERVSGQSLAQAPWVAGFEASLADVLTSRLAFYALIHRVRRLSFLPRVVASWAHIHRLMQAARA